MGLTIFTPCTTRGTPIINAIDVMADTWTVGIPARSISFASAAPQRVLVPQVDVRMAPDTPSDLSSAAIDRPILRAISSFVATPVVL